MKDGEELALVNGLADDGRLIVGFYDREHTAPVRDQTANAETGDIVNVVKPTYQEEYADEVIKKGGEEESTTVAVVENILDDKIVIRHENGQQVISRPRESLEEGNTIALTHSGTFGRVVSPDPIQIEPKPDEEMVVDNLNLNFGDEDDGDQSGRFQPEDTGDVKFEDIIGLRNAKERIYEAVTLPIEKEEQMERFDIDGQFGILFYGKPGTGKTMMAKAAANELGSSNLFFHIGGPEIVSKYYGESERQIRDVFEAAKDQAQEEEKPAVVFIDELDSVVPRRDRADETERRIVAQFLSELDGLESRGDIIVIGATNLVDVIDPAVRRSGRFDEEIEFSLPDIEERAKMLKKHSENMPVSSNVDFGALADQTGDWSGADLESIVKKARIIAVKEDRSNVTHEDFIIALERFNEQRKASQERLRNEERQQ